jgi:hypothetical protein
MVRFEFTVIAQVPVPEQEEMLQPEKVYPEDAAAVKVTKVPELKGEEQVEPQAIPKGLLITMPFVGMMVRV